jgi:dienelactone hydrolase
MKAVRFLCWGLTAAALAMPGAAKEPRELLSSDLARAFGSAPSMWGLSISPDGTRFSAIQMHPSGATFARVFSFAGGDPILVLAGQRDEFDVAWCRWANDERLLCGVRAIQMVQSTFVPFTRLIATAADGSGTKVLLERLLEDEILAQYQDRIVDWLPDDPKHVLVQYPTDDGRGVGRLNVYDGRLTGEIPPKSNVHEGRLALFAAELSSGHPRRLVYANPDFDVSGIRSLGKFNRIVGVAYLDDRPRMHYFDARVSSIHDAIARTFPDRNVAIFDESWDRRYYLVRVSGATDAGTYYRYDSQANELGHIATLYPALGSRALAPVKTVRYPARDGTQIPAYLTLPAGHNGAGPAIILPHGGPSARDYWTFDFLVQYLAASGYAVLQSNYRGSDGYGVAWLGDGGFRGWRRAVGDITDGTRYLIAEGIADPQRICVVGWSYGGYAALMSGIEHPELYRCVASIAGVTDPGRLNFWARNFVGGIGAAAFIGQDDEVLKRGSPVNRARELQDPVFLVHPKRDNTVPVEHSRALARALDSNRAGDVFVEYDHAEHDIGPERYRIDLLARLAGFLEKNMGAQGAPPAAASAGE